MDQCTRNLSRKELGWDQQEGRQDSRRGRESKSEICTTVRKRIMGQKSGEILYILETGKISSAAAELLLYGRERQSAAANWEYV